MIAKDKILHIIVGCAITVLGLSFLGFWGLILPIILSIGKEIYDVYKKDLYKFNMADLFASAAGIALGCIIFFVFIEYRLI